MPKRTKEITSRYKVSPTAKYSSVRDCKHQIPIVIGAKNSPLVMGLCRICKVPVYQDRVSWEENKKKKKDKKKG